jgi:Big-like domain-containing protein
LREVTLLHPWRLALMLAIAFAMAVTAILAPIPVRAGAAGQKVVVIVGPVGGGSIQTNYLNRGESIADAAEARGATVVRVFSPNATYAAARAAVNGANIIVYIGHGSGYPNPYSSTLQPAWNNGWGLNAIAGVDAYDPTGHGHTIGGSNPSMLYCGEAVLEGKPKPTYVSSSQWCAGGGITPAPGFVMVFSNACYAPGAGETEQTTPSSQTTARTRVQYFSRPYLALGGTYFASDLGSQSVVTAVLDNPTMAFGDIFRLGNGYSNTAVRGFSHALSPGKQAWIQKTSGPGGLMSYWYAFGGDPARTPAGGTAAYVPLPPAPDEEAPYFVALSPLPNATGVSTTPSVTVRFSEPVLGVGAGNTVLRDNVTSAVIASTVAYDPATYTATLTPSAALQPNRVFRMAMSGSIVDASGNPLPFTQWYFTTGAVPLSGIQNQEMFDPWRSVAFAAGSHTGYLYTAGGAVTGSKTYSLVTGSGASASGRAVINGTPHVLIANGVWANYWVPESSRVVLASGTTAPPPPPPPSGSGVFDPPRSLSFSAGTHTGYQFDSAGVVTSSKAYTLTGASAAATSQRTAVTGQSGTWFLVSNGLWSGYWVRESAQVYLAGFMDQVTFSPWRGVSLAGGTHTGYTFNGSGGVTGTKAYTLGSASSASSSGRAIINGRAYVQVANGVWAGYWIPESSGVVLN